MLISIVNRSALFCSTGGLIESIISSTGWCVFSGVSVCPTVTLFIYTHVTVYGIGCTVY